MTEIIQFASVPENGAVQKHAIQSGQHDDQKNKEKAGEIRSYYIPAHALKDEQKYLESTGAENSFDLMGQTLDRLYVLLVLMEHTTIKESMPDDFIELLGDYLHDSLDILERVSNFFGEMKHIGKTAPANEAATSE